MQIRLVFSIIFTKSVLSLSLAYLSKFLGYIEYLKYSQLEVIIDEILIEFMQSFVQYNNQFPSIISYLETLK